MYVYDWRHVRLLIVKYLTLVTKLKYFKQLQKVNVYNKNLQQSGYYCAQLQILRFNVDLYMYFNINIVISVCKNMYHRIYRMWFFFISVKSLLNDDYLSTRLNSNCQNLFFLIIRVFPYFRRVKTMLALTGR